MTNSQVTFFLTAGKAPRKAKAKPPATARAGLTKQDRAAVKAYLGASPAERKLILRADGINSGKIIDLNARRAWRRSYMRQYRALKSLGTVRLQEKQPAQRYVYIPASASCSPRIGRKRGEKLVLPRHS
jgi:hypothetical protein